MTSRHDAILDAALVAFTKKGYDGVGLREIAKTAGVAQATINYHFDTKMKLMEAVIARGATVTITSRLKELAKVMEAEVPATLETVAGVIFKPYNLPHDNASTDERAFTQFIAATGAGASDDAKRAIMKAYNEMADAFIDAILATDEGFDRLSAAKAYLYALPTGMFAIDHAFRIPMLSRCDPDDAGVEFSFSDLIAFVCAGMRALKP